MLWKGLVSTDRGDYRAALRELGRARREYQRADSPKLLIADMLRLRLSFRLSGDAMQREVLADLNESCKYDKGNHEEVCKALADGNSPAFLNAHRPSDNLEETELCSQGND